MVGKHHRNNPKEDKPFYPRKEDKKPKFEGPKICERCYGMNKDCPSCHGTGEIE